jgi:ferric-chelate reductase [NAD(P)H]
MDLTTFCLISYGLYIIGSRKGNRLNGQIANSVFQVTSNPPKIAVCINKLNLTHEYIKDSGIFSISILEKETPLKFIGQFGFKSGRDIDKFKGVEFKLCDNRTPALLEHSLGCIEAKVVDEMDVKTHTIFVGEVINAVRLKSGEPMTYAYYHEVKRGKSPKAAPIYVEEKVKKGG